MSDNLYTAVASSMVANTDIVVARLAPMLLGTSKRKLGLSAPAGPSSEKGQLARQSMTLSSETEHAVCGWVDFVAARAELRDFRAVKDAYEARYKKAFDVREDEYRAFLTRLQDVLRELEVRVQVVGSDEEAYAVTDPATIPGRSMNAGPGPRSSSSALPFVLLIGLLVVVGFGALFFLVF